MTTEEVQALRVRLDELEAEVRTLREEQPVSRRRMLGMLKGAAAAGAGAAVLGSARTAHADIVGPGVADGHALQIGGSNTNSSNSTLLTGSAPNTFVNDGILSVKHTATDGGTAVVAEVQSSTATKGFGVLSLASGAGGAVWGACSGSGVAIKATSLNGAAVLVQDNLDAYGSGSPVMPPTTGTWATGSLINSLGQLWYCYVAGTGSASKWVRLSSPFVPVTPTRVYDSRVGAPLPTGAISAGQNRLVSVADGRNGAGAVSVPNLVPAGATAITANVTVTATTTAFGYLAINPGGNTTEGASTINWFGASQSLANGVTLTLNASREVTVICNGLAGASTHFIIDVSGYYL